MGLGTLGARPAVVDEVDWIAAEAAGPVTPGELMVGRGAPLRFADIGDFRKGEDLLAVTIYAGAGVEEVEVEIRPSPDGKDSCLVANRQVLVILRGIPEAGFDDFRVRVQPVEA